MSYSTQKLDNIWMSYLLKQCKLISKCPPVHKITGLRTGKQWEKIEEETSCQSKKRNKRFSQLTNNLHSIIIRNHFFPKLFHSNLNSTPKCKNECPLAYININFVKDETVASGNRATTLLKGKKKKNLISSTSAIWQIKFLRI